MPDIYVSVDIESDGPIPGDNSMLSLGAAAFKDGIMISTFTCNIDKLPNSFEDLDTMNFWRDNWEAYLETRKNCEHPKDAMTRLSNWLRSLPGRPVFVGYPASYDWMFTHWYLVKFTGDDPFGFTGLDMKSYAAAMLKIPFTQTTKRTMPRKWFPKNRHTHIALDDAIEQGIIWMNMLKEQENI